MVKSVLGFPELAEVTQACVGACLLVPGQFPALWSKSHARLSFFLHFSPGLSAGCHSDLCPALHPRYP